MEKKTKRNGNMKKSFFIITLAALLASCGSGGGGGGGGSSSTPTNPGTTTTSELEGGNNSRFNSRGNIQWNGSFSYSSSNPHNNSNTTYTGSGVTVGIIDSGFNNSTLEADLISDYGSRYSKVSTSNTSELSDYHGITIAKLIGGNSMGIAKGVTLVAADASSGDDLLPTTTMYYSLYNKGARIFNQSFGSDGSLTGYSTNPSSSNYYGNSIGSGFLTFFRMAVSNGALFVWAAGNEENQTYSTFESTLPYWDNSLEEGWLNVVGLTQKTWPATGTNLSWNNLRPLSEAGAAKNWTISAIADYSIPVNGSTLRLGGSSNSTGIVSGTAALIKQKYPFMTGSLLRQTILSTATDIGDAGVDDVYGWGLLNIDKALNGPSLFSKSLALADSVVVDFSKGGSGGSYTFSNNISGDAGLTLTGTGTLYLTGTTSFTGNTSVGSNAALYINGTRRYASALSIDKTGTVGVNETVLESSVDNAGTFVNRGDSTIEGTYSATESSKLVSELSSSLKVNGEVNLNDSTIEVLAEKKGEAEYVTSKGTTVNVISSNTGLTGTPSVTVTETLKNEVKQDDNSIDVTVSRKNVEDYVNEINGDQMQKDVASSLETSLSVLDSKIENGELSTASPFAKSAAELQRMALVSNNRQAVLDSLSGQIYASAQALTFEQSQTVNKDLSNRLVMLGTLDNTGEKFGLWTSLIGSDGKIKQDGYGEGKTKTYGGQVGVDKKFGNNLILGTALSFSEANVKFDRYGGESDSTSFGVSLYGRLGNKNTPFYVQGRVGLGFVDSDVERDIILSSTSYSRAKVNHNDRVVSGYVETGYDIKNRAEDFVVTPFVGLSYDSVRRGSFSEENSQFGLTADKKTYEQTSGLVGLRVGKSINFASGTKTTLQGYATYQKSFKKEDLSFEASYTGLQDAKFEVKGIGLKREKTWVGIGALTEFNPNFAWYVNYDAKLESGNSYNNVFTTGFRWSF